MNNFKSILFTAIIVTGFLICFLPYLLYPDLPVLGIDAESYYRPDVKVGDYLYVTHSMIGGLGWFIGLDFAVKVFPFFLVLFTAFATGFLVRSLKYDVEWCLLAGLFSVVSFQTVAGLFSYVSAQWLAYGLLVMFSAFWIREKYPIGVSTVFLFLTFIVHLYTFMTILGLICLYFILFRFGERMDVREKECYVGILSMLGIGVIAFWDRLVIPYFSAFFSDMDLVVKVESWLFHAVNGANFSPLVLISIFVVGALMVTVLFMGTFEVKHKGVRWMTILGLLFFTVFLASDDLAWRLTFLIPFPVFFVMLARRLEQLSDLWTYTFIISVFAVQTVLALGWWLMFHTHFMLYGSL